MIGIVACNVFREETERIRENGKVKYLPQGLHDIVKSDEMTQQIQEKIDEFDDDLEYIALFYGDCGNGIEGVYSEKYPLVVPRVEDCISLLTGVLDSKNLGTFYLSRGWIDHGIDPLKIFKVRLGETEDLLSLFRKGQEKNSNLTFEWHENDKIQQLMEFDRKFSRDELGEIFYKILKHYSRIELIDNNNLFEFHKKYAKKIREFLQYLHDEYGNVEDVTLEISNGSLSILEKMLDKIRDLEDDDNIAVFKSGESVELNLGRDRTQTLEGI